MQYYFTPEFLAGFKFVNNTVDGLVTSITGSSETKVVSESAVAALKTELQTQLTNSNSEYTVTPDSAAYTGGGAEEWKYTIPASEHLRVGHPVVISTNAAGNVVKIDCQYITSATPTDNATMDIVISLHGGHDLTTTPVTYYVR